MAVSFAMIITLLIPTLNILLGWWNWFSFFYVYLAVIFVWFSLIILFIVDVRKSVDYGIDALIKYSVIIPVYNERPDLLRKCVESIITNIGEKEIIIADDGSTKQETKEEILRLEQSYQQTIKVVRLPVNKGKKFAQIEAVNIATNEFCVTTDSDTVFDMDSLSRLVSPLINPKIGLTNTNVEILNKDVNLMTKMQQLQMYGAFKIGRKSLGGLGIMNCASGIGIGFRKSEMLTIKDHYLDKRPFGFDCKFGEDRFMTNLYLKRGFKIFFVEKAIAHTEVPEKLSSYFKQQLRWKISGVIEGIHVITFSHRTSWVLWLHSVLNFTLPFLCISMVITLLLVDTLNSDFLGIIAFLCVTILATLVRDVTIFIERKDLIKYIIPYTFLNLFGLLWLWIVALFRIDEQSWITR